jgi:ribonuclease HI
MELMAAIEGLRALKVPCRVCLVSDSSYLKKGITDFLPKWKSNNWIKSNGEPVLNQDLWDQLDQIAQRHEIQWGWTAGHGDHADQNRADQLAFRTGRAQAAQGAHYL